MTSRTGDDRFATFDIVLKRRGRGRWKWSVRTTDGHAVMCGSECSRAGARYKAERAVFRLCASASRLPSVALAKASYEIELLLPEQKLAVTEGAPHRGRC